VPTTRPQKFTHLASRAGDDDAVVDAWTSWSSNLGEASTLAPPSYLFNPHIHTFPSPNSPHNPNQNAPHIHHQDRARRRRSPLLLCLRPAHGRGLNRLWCLEAHRCRGRVRQPPRNHAIGNQGETANSIHRDAFTKREKAAEELYIRQEEKAKYVSQQAPAQHQANTDAGSWLSRRSSARRGNTSRTSTSTCTSTRTTPRTELRLTYTATM
jgi:hypothetical protein